MDGLERVRVSPFARCNRDDVVVSILRHTNRDDGFSWFSKVIAVLQFGLHLSGCPLQGLPPARVAPYGWHAARISFNE